MIDEAPVTCPDGQASESQPQAVVLGAGEILQVQWRTTRFTLSAQRLRAACRCASCRRAQIDRQFPAEFPGVMVVWENPVGHYGVNLGFSDGHDRGIYPWSYLAELAGSAA